MATYTEKPFLEGAHYSRVGTQFAWRCVSRAYDDNDVVKILWVERDTKVMAAAVDMATEIDANAGPTATLTLRLNNGTLQQNLVTLDATACGIATGTVVHINVPTAVGYVVPARGYWLELVVGLVATVAAATVIGVSFQASNVMYGTESPLAPTGS